MVVLLTTASVWVSFIQIMQIKVQNKWKSIRKSRYDRDVSGTNRDQWASLLDHIHWSRFVARTGKKGGALVTVLAINRDK